MCASLERLETEEAAWLIQDAKEALANSTCDGRQEKGLQDGRYTGGRDSEAEGKEEMGSRQSEDMTLGHGLSGESLAGGGHGQRATDSATWNSQQGKAIGSSDAKTTGWVHDADGSSQGE